MPGLAATVAGTCSGHGVCIPEHIHQFLGACSPPYTSPFPIIPKPVSTKDATCNWPPLNTRLKVPIARNVLINGQVPLLHGDLLTIHPSSCTNLVTRLVPSGDSCARLDSKSIPCGKLSLEDMVYNGKGHDRRVIASGKSVLVNGRPLATVGDPLGPPCRSVIATGSINVMVGK
jgi:hypothetical protein